MIPSSTHPKEYHVFSLGPPEHVNSKKDTHQNDNTVTLEKGVGLTGIFKGAFASFVNFFSV